MPQAATTSMQDRVIDFTITAIVFSVFNYFGRYKAYAGDLAKHIGFSLAAGMAVALVLAIIRPPIKAWLRARREAKRMG